MMSIGMIPATIAPATRRAALRGHIRFEPTADQLKTAAEQAGQSIEDMKKSEEYDPYFSLKAVLVEENGALKVGYFEFVPRSMLD
ncbi:MAG: hypothetical protein JO317_01690 [Verrucomicrobiae bacterium]|nr:hypothetical protein [Verrucomicrobiae bacterium]